MFKRYRERKARERDVRIAYYREEYRGFNEAAREAVRWSMVRWAATTFFRNQEIIERCIAAEAVCREEASGA